jgi:hypothetical protein
MDKEKFLKWILAVRETAQADLNHDHDDWDESIVHLADYIILTTKKGVFDEDE